MTVGRARIRHERITPFNTHGTGFATSFAFPEPRRTRTAPSTGSAKPAAVPNKSHLRIADLPTNNGLTKQEAGYRVGKLPRNRVHSAVFLPFKHDQSAIRQGVHQSLDSPL